MEKNPRDRLFDIGIKLTVVYAMVPEPTNTKIARDCGSIYDELLLWKQELIQGGNADFQIPCRGCHQTPCLCFPHRSMFPNNEFSYMAADCLAFLLLTIRKASSTLPPQFQDINTATHVASKLAISQGTLARQTEWLRMELREVLNLPCFGQAASDLPGITEGRCCSLLPIWALAQVDRTDHPCQSDWWQELENRLNYGTAF